MADGPRVRLTGAPPGARDDDVVRRILEAAAARPDEIPGLPPFFAARVRAAARAARGRGPLQFLGSVAWHALPALAALLVTLSLLVGLETGREADAQEDDALAVLQSHNAGSDAPLTTLLLASGGEQAAPGGAR